MEAQASRFTAVRHALPIERTRCLLTLEPLPIGARSNIRDLLTSTQWNKIKLEVAAAARSHCVICDGRGNKWPVECHEKWHFDYFGKVQTLERFEALCPRCHKVKHHEYALEKGLGPTLIRHLARVNGWSWGRAQAHIDDVTQAVQALPSYVPWVLDLGLLTRYGIHLNTLKGTVYAR